MQPRSHEDLLVEHGAVRATVLQGRDGIDEAIALLDRAEAAAGVPLVDEAERVRLHALADGDDERADHWHSVVARRGVEVTGYAGILLPATPGAAASGDLAVDRSLPPCGPVLTSLLEAAEALAVDHGAARLQVWLRHASSGDVGCVADAGYSIARRLGVLGRPLDESIEVGPLAGGGTIRSVRPDDHDEVVRVLAAAYAGTPDDGWDAERFAARRALPWYRAEDLLVAEVDGRLVGVHWTKRRGGGVGEVYNLAVDPAVQGAGYGGVLLRAGLAHLAALGCRQVLLWVDLSNERAVRTYASHGFHTQWEDLALGRTLRRQSSVA